MLTTGFNRFLNFQEITTTTLFECSFSITIHLINEHQQIIPHDPHHRIHLKIYPENDVAHECAKGTMHVEDESGGCLMNGVYKCRVIIHYVPENNNAQRFLLRISANDANIIPCYSPTIHCFKYRLLFEYLEDDLKVWYKDENKRERHIEYQVSLLNAANQVVRNKYLYLEASLCYENGNLVPHANILSIHTECRLSIDESGTTRIKFRINDVSKNHQRQKFRLVLACVGGSESELVVPCLSRPIEVKSKRSRTGSFDRNNYRESCYDAKPILTRHVDTMFEKNSEILKKASLPSYLTNNGVRYLPSVYRVQVPVERATGIYSGSKSSDFSEIR